MIVLAAALAVVGQTRPPPTENVPAKTLQARGLLNQAKVYALRIKNHFQRDEIVDEIGVAQANAGDLEDAIDTANRADLPPIATLNAIGERLAQSNDLQKAKSLGNRLKEGAPYALLSGMARSQAKAGRFTQALMTANEIQFPEVRSYALEDIAALQAATGDYSGARKTFALARAAHQKGLLTEDELETIIMITELLRGEVPPARLKIEQLKTSEDKSGLMIGVAEALWKKGDKNEAALWLDAALKQLPAEPNNDFARYLTIPTQVRLGQQDIALQAAARLSGEMRVKGFMAVAVTCAELKNAGCVDKAINKMQSALTPAEKTGSEDFGLKLMMLNVTSALIDNGQSEAALRWLAVIEGDRADVSYEFAIAPRAALQRVLILSRQERFVEARTLALKIKPDSMTDKYRGTALRMLALLQTKKSGNKAVEAWMLRLRTPEERAYALLGIAQALIGIEETRLGYSAIHIH